MTQRFCFLDMDGVLFDFVPSCCEYHNLPNPYDNPENYGNWDMHKIWKISVKEFYAPLLKPGFWLNLPKTKYADELVDWACSEFGTQNVCILTNPGSHAPLAISEKKACVRRHYPHLADNMLFGKPKHFLAGPGRFLVDDRDKNVEDFNEFGGIGLVYPQLWNKEWAWSDNPVNNIQIQMELATLVQT